MFKVSVFENVVPCCIIMVFVTGFSQTKEIDSLEKELLDKKANILEYQKDTSFINSLNSLAYQYVSINIDSTKAIADKALELAKIIDYDRGIARSLFHKGIYFSEIGQGNKAFVHYEEALKIALVGGDAHLLFDIRNNQGIEYRLRGDFDKSLELLLENLKLARSRDDPRDISFACSNIANLFALQEEYEIAQPYYEEAFKAATRTKEDYPIGITMLNLAFVYVESGRTEQAKQQLKKCKAFFEEHGSNYLWGEIYLYEARFHYNNEQYGLAYDSMLKSFDFLDESNDSQINYALRYQMMADILLKSKAYDQALEYAEKAYSIGKNTNDLRGVTYASQTLYKYHKVMGSSVNSLLYLEDFKKHSDSLYNTQNKNGILLMQARSDFEKKQAELKAINDKNLLAKQNKINTAIWIILILLATLIPLYVKHRKLGFLNRKITEKSKLLENREVELVNSNTTKGRLFSIIGHDLKGPIDSLRLLLDMHQKKEITDMEFLEFSPKLNKDVSSVFFTLTNLLNWGRSQMEGDFLAQKNFHVKPLVKDVIRFLEAAIEAKQLQVFNEVKEKTQVYADRDQMDVVIRNLISNAIKFTNPNGTIKVISQDFEEHYRLSILDNGIGMDAKTCSKVMDPRDTHTTYGTNNEKGTGLGLSLCKELVEKNQGEIWAESTLGKGSTFHVLLPRSKERRRKDGFRG